MQRNAAESARGRGSDPGPAGAELVVCETCRSQAHATGEEPHGATLAGAIERALPDDGGPVRVSVSRTRCLWACKRGCNVHLRSDGRVGYVIAELEPTETHARALVEFARMYAESTDGAVPFRSWPDALRGHFLCRTPAPRSSEESV